MIYLFGIFYDDSTKGRVPANFIPLDNTAPVDPSWYEYSPIFNVFNTKIFNNDDYIGFFSPRLHEKTGLLDYEVLKVVSQSKAEVISFSPHLFANCFYINGFYQGEVHHPGLIEISQSIVDYLQLDMDISSLWQDQTRIIFSNYFVAKYSFWKKWLELTRRVYDLSTNESSPFFKKLNEDCPHRNQTSGYQYKVFVLERMVSLALEKYSINAELGIDFGKYVMGNTPTAKNVQKLLALDSLKSQYIKTKKNYYAKTYEILTQRNQR